MKLPHEILERILDFLLNAEYAKDPPGTPLELAVAKYHFHTKVLRVNKLISSIGTSIFRRNHFVLVSTSDPDLLSALQDDDVWFRTQKMSYFKSYTLRLHLAPRKSIRVSNQFFMMCRDNVSDLVIHLRMMNVLKPRWWKFKFDILKRANMSLRPDEQQRFIEPFLKTRTRWQECTIRGAIGSDLARSLEASMMPKTHWLREIAWHLLEMVHYKKAIADNKLQSREIVGAHKAYDNYFTFYQNTREYALTLCDDDDRLASSFDRLYNLAQLNWWIANIAMAFAYPRPQYRQNLYDSIVTNAEKALAAKVFMGHELAMCHIICTLGYFGLQDYNKAISSVEHVTSVSSQYDGRMSDFVNNFEQLKLINKASVKFQAQYTRCLQILTSCFSLEPFRCTIPQQLSVSHVVEFERYVLARIGYTGDMLEDKVVQVEGYTTDPLEQRDYQGSLDTERADHYVAKLKQEPTLMTNDFLFGMQKSRGAASGRMRIADELTALHLGGHVVNLET